MAWCSFRKRKRGQACMQFEIIEAQYYDVLIIIYKRIDLSMHVVHSSTITTDCRTFWSCV